MPATVRFVAVVEVELGVPNETVDGPLTCVQATVNVSPGSETDPTNDTLLVGKVIAETGLIDTEGAALDAFTVTETVAEPVAPWLSVAVNFML